MTDAREPAVLVLEDGRTFHGRSYGRRGETVGEGVFCTAMTGYQETLTDPSYHRQVVVLDSAVEDEATLVATLEQRLGVRVHGVTVQRLDLVNDTTWVEVRYRVPSGVPERSAEAGIASPARTPAQVP